MLNSPARELILIRSHVPVGLDSLTRSTPGIEVSALCLSAARSLLKILSPLSTSFLSVKITPKVCLLVNYSRFFAMYALIYAEKYTKYGIVFYAH